MAPARRARLFVMALAVSSGLALAAAGCGGDEVSTVDGLDAAPGLSITTVATGLDGPTQLIHHPDGRLIIAELNGGENDGTGRITAIDVDGDGDGASEVLVDGLLKPTGVAVVDDRLWIMEERTLSHAPLGGGTPTPVVEDMPYNGRSQTTLTVDAEGRVLYGTSGSIRRGAVVEGSGVLWAHDPVTGSTPVATGFKNPYGHVFDADGRLWVTEVSDGTFDDRPAADELVELVADADHGWPACVGDREAVAEFGGDQVTCASGPPSQALFNPGATPTSVAVAPWDERLLVVALWAERRIVTVSTAAEGRPHKPTDLVTGDLRPQHLLTDGDRLLVVDFDGGRILALTSPDRMPVAP